MKQFFKFGDTRYFVTRDTHPDVETITMYADVYEWFTRDVFFETQKKWDAHKNTLFGNDMDYKAFLESYFNVSLDGDQGV